ncbi:GNAT family N-acetyltransferase [Streptococcus sp. 20-1249]|uniref:GNAT family N-acetyltransferase n=1 Tax=Streptococcus hepaticus TaxID=3349163 RepID=UPI0037488D4D
MENLLLVAPSLDFADQISAYKSAFAGEHLHGGSRLQEMDSLTDWLAHLERESSYATCRPNRSPSSTFLCIRESDQKMVGIVNIRHDIKQEFLLHIAGHIGYSIHPDERRKGYATEQLRLALEECRKFGLERVLVTAADWNIGSQKTILANGGVYEDSRLDESDGDLMLRYWIDIK